VGPLQRIYTGLLDVMDAVRWPTTPSALAARTVMRQRDSESGMTKLKLTRPLASVLSVGRQAAVSMFSRRGRVSTFNARWL
jgi:hypothetical protein